MFTKFFLHFLNYTKCVSRVHSRWNSTQSNNIVKNIAILNKPLDMLNHLSKDFIDWFRGFVDAEGCFLILHRKGSTFEFEFSIKLHIDDKGVLEYIISQTGVGTIRVDRNGTSVTYKVSNQKELALIVALFSKYSLNTTKHLNFLAFAEAYNLYMTNKSLVERKAIVPLLKDLKDSMNSKRTNFDMPKDHFIINSYWLLGFFEGDGSFYFSSDRNTVVFALTQKGNLDLMIAIKEFLLRANSNISEIKSNLIKVESKDRGVTILSIYSAEFIQLVIIPLFDDLIFRSKKYLDYCDGKAILSLFNKGLHYLPEGQELITHITGQMNNNRLSTSKALFVNREKLLEDIEILMSQPSNYELIDGRVFIKSLNKYRNTNKAVAVELIELSSGNVVKTFSQLTECSKYLGVSLSTVYNRVQKSNQFQLNNNLVYLRKVVSS